MRSETLRLRTLIIASLIPAIVVVMLLLAASRTPEPVRPVLLPADTLPGSLTDAEFWKMSSDFSERSGSFLFGSV